VKRSPRESFRVRLAYLRWLSNAGKVPPEKDSEFAQRAGVGYEWLKKWMKRDDAPDDRTLTAKLAEALGADPAWLFDGEGTAPQPVLWTAFHTGTPIEDLDIAAPLAPAKKRKGA
jgi:transcriptional regulator with XRE-family HTH domain